MSKTIRNRVEQLEELLPPNQAPTQGHEDLRGWLRRLDRWPAEMISPRLTDEEIAELRGACRGIANRVRAGKLTTSSEICEQLPDDALLGIRAYFHQWKKSNEERLVSQ